MNAQDVITARQAIASSIEDFVQLADPDYADGCICLGFITYAEVVTPLGERREMAFVTGSADGSAGTPWQLKGYFGHMTPLLGRALS